MAMTSCDAEASEGAASVVHGDRERARHDERSPSSGRVPPMLLIPPWAMLRVLKRLLRTAEQAQATIESLPQLIDESRELVRDLRALVRRTEELAGMARRWIGNGDLERVLSRVARIEQAILNTEAASLNLDRAFEGSVESLPKFMARRARQESEKIEPTRAPGAGPEAGHDVPTTVSRGSCVSDKGVAGD